MITIRAATPDDIDRIVGLAAAMMAECPTDWPPVERDRLARQVELSQQMPGVFLFALAESDARLIGGVTGVSGDYAWSSQKRAVCDLLFLAPGFRGYTAAMALIDHFRLWGVAQGARRLFAGNLTGYEQDRMGKLFERAGYARAGTTYWMEIG